jgi:hypothetical protein
VRVRLGGLAAGATICWAIGFNLCLVATAQTYFALNQLRSATPAERLHQEFFLVSPFLLAVPVAGWASARFARWGQKWARYGVEASTAGWAITAAFIHWGWMLQ